MAALSLASDWPRLLDLVAWPRAHPCPGLYLRQVDVPGAYTKFLERHRGVLAELFDLVRPHEAIWDDATGRSGFELRYGFRSKPVRIRFRVLDPASSILGMNASGADAEEDVTVPIQTFAALWMDASNVFIVKNEIDVLSFFVRARMVVVFWAGYGFDVLADVVRLRQVVVHYWGNIDTHGFAILHQECGVVPHAWSVLTDRETLLAHRETSRRTLHRAVRIHPSVNTVRMLDPTRRHTRRACGSVGRKSR